MVTLQSWTGIDNVARKSVVDYVLTGAHSPVETLRKYCSEETISKKEQARNVIGFQSL